MIPLIAAALYGMAGYQNNERRKRSDTRENMLDARDNETHNAKMAQESDRVAEVQREKDFRDANSAALSAGKLDQGQQVMGSEGSNAFTKDADAASMMAEMAQAKGETVKLNDASRVSTGRQGATMQGTVAGNQVFADPIQAQAFAKTQTMGEWAKMKAQKEVAEQFGKPDLSDSIRSNMAKLEGEGAFKALAMAKAGDFAGAAAHYGATGNDRLPDGATFDSVETTDPITRQPRQTIRMVGKDGKPLIADMDQAFRAYLTPGEQYTMERGDAKLSMDERRTSVAERAADTAAKAQAANERKIEGMLSGLIGGRGHGGAAGSPGATPGVGLKDRRDYLSDFSASLPDPKTATDPKEATAITSGNQRILAQADAVFSTNAELGNILTAPQASAAMTLAQTPSNIKRIRDNNTGSIYETVSVNGKPIIIGVAGANPRPETQPSKADEKAPAALPKPGGAMAGTVQPKSSPQQTNTPTYEKWLAAKNEKDKLIATAQKMSPDRREGYLVNRLPGLEQAIKINQNYKTY